MGPCVEMGNLRGLVLRNVVMLIVRVGRVRIILLVNYHSRIRLYLGKSVALAINLPEGAGYQETEEQDPLQVNQYQGKDLPAEEGEFVEFWMSYP
ncbi:hypothetical protein RHMOL_Rhmol03G0145900 [Rhododendron molle]|uniref:Uncharacterized protein n=1 Tax=Rhododendron molle TaxID=49168 RepID=A0ACC0PFE2_RHOML|nr:hypothetical protein RHMOL_Rhmol03G0145900 [Rhododendron molle]